MKKNIFKVLSLVLCVCLMCLMFAGCGSKKIKIAIVQPLSHTSLDQIRDTIIEELKASGRDIEIVTANANNDTSSFATIFSNYVSEGVDIVVPIATGTAQSAKAAFEGSNTPIVFAAVSDPVEAGLTGEGCENITGVSDNIVADQIIKLVKTFQPNVKKLGFLYTQSETNSVSTVKAAKEYCDSINLAYEEATVQNLSELQTAAETLISKGVDAFYTGTDNAIASAMSAYCDVAYSKNIPIYCGADSMVSDGGFATVGVNYQNLGKQVAQIILKILDGAKPADIPYETLNELTTQVNLQAAKKIGMTISSDILSNIAVLVEEDGTSHFGE